MTETAPQLSKNVRILIVEDDEDMRGLLLETVNRLGYLSSNGNGKSERSAFVDRTR